MDVVNEKIGAEGELDLDFQDGKLVLIVTHKHASGEVALTVKEDAAYFMDKLAAKIPGKVDDTIFEVIKGAMKAV